ncbi:MAG: PepSY-associated TM helix domain-containing protein, partial [Pseudomonadota bacterium]
MAIPSDLNAPRSATATPRRRSAPAVQGSPAKAKNKRLTARKVSWLIHSFVGLKLTVVMTIVFLTGTLAVFYEEIDWLIYDEIRVTPIGEKLNPGEVYDRATAEIAERGLG